MLDTHAAAGSLTDAEFTPARADAVTNAMRPAAEHGDHVTTDQIEAGFAKLRADPQAGVAAGNRRVVGAVSPGAAVVAAILLPAGS